MPNIALVLKQEILRLSNKAVRSAVAPINRDKVVLKKAVRELKKRVKKLEQVNELLTAEQQRHQKLIVEAVPAQEIKMRVTAKGVRSLRRKLGLSQAEFAKLVGVSALSVYQWERKQGALRLRDDTKKRLFAVRDIGRKEVKLRLSAGQGQNPSPSSRRSNA